MATKHLFFSTIFSLLFFLSCSSTEQVHQSMDTSQTNVDISAIERPIPYPLDIPAGYLNAIENGTRTSTGAPGENYWQNEASYDLHAEIDPDTHTLYGKASINYQNNSPDDLQVLVIELAQNLHKEGTPKKETTEITGGIDLTHISVNGKTYEETTFWELWSQDSSGYVLDGTHLYIYPDEILRPGDSTNFDFEWNFVIPEQGASGRMGHSRDNLYYIAYWYPQVSVYDDVYGWFSDSFVGNAEFYHGYADYNVTINMPADWLVMSTGEFLNPEETLSTQTLERYNQAAESDDVVVIVDFDEIENSTASPTNDLLTWKFQAKEVMDVAFSATRESRWDGTRSPVGDLNGDGTTEYTRIHTFYRDTAPLWEQQAEYAQHSIEFLSDYTELPYPWPHMTSVEGADIISGGMEFPMMTVIGDYNSAGAVRLYGVTAHELAHMWFPMMISTNERRYTWIDEGYTTYHTNEANIDYYGSDRFNRMDVFSNYLQISGTEQEGEMMRWSDFHYPGPAYGIASYAKPGSVLYALRTVIGDDVFMEAHLELIQRWKYKHPYPWDIFKTFEDVSGQNLDWFWRAWYYETWVLDQKVADVYKEDNRTIIEIEDLGQIPMPVLLTIQLEDGTEIKERLEVEPWLNGKRVQRFESNIEKTVVRVEIDAEHQLPDTDRSNNVWER